MDWFGASLSLLGWFLMARHRNKALPVLLTANCAWIAWAAPLHIWSLAALQVCFIILNIRALQEWKKEVAPSKPN
jgi:hypothetical protein